ncbi:Glycosyl transferase family 2 [Mucilaginibacter lappiensis]|uniref:Glycosyltransferase involved in cell wall biosynthesis n=1 Tax=Mucilaginibacter lappiensis TaxID=354630 RepID=A0ABR6PH58_9SPHI|nr:glycosyltransferase family A protein [Mucilaginibacter lappiensis]MBB6109098.1 glycosyltransferase involved in cell wall biosynthesis [Mucilaginibacter lappiensis]SIQ75531.1 Glycosyl transferase family 2 [Mucilaginibacter lappiensis]
MTPAISVTMPVYNSASFLREAMDSILTQSFTDFEFVILNDGSTDNSKEIILSYNDPRIIFYDGKINVGLAHIRNKGIEISQGKYLAIMDSDDIATPDRLQKQFDYLESNRDIVMCGGFFTPFGNKNSVLNFNWVTETDPEMVKINLLFDGAICQPTVMIRSSTLKETGLKYESYFDPAEDYKLWVSLSKNHLIANIQDQVLKYRLSDNQISNTKNQVQRERKFEVIKDQLSWLGITPTEAEMRIHDHMFFASAILSYDYLPKMKTWIDKLINANKKFKLYDEQKLSDYLNDLYIRNKTALKQALKNSSPKSIAVFYFKTLIRWKSIR